MASTMVLWRVTLFLQITVDDRNYRRSQFVLFQQVPEVHDRGVFGDRRAQHQVCELANGGDFVERFFHGRMVQMRTSFATDVCAA